MIFMTFNLQSRFTYDLLYLRGLDPALDKLSARFRKGDNFCDFLFAFLQLKPFWKSSLNGNNLLPMSKFFPFREDKFATPMSF